MTYKSIFFLLCFSGISSTMGMAQDVDRSSSQKNESKLKSSSFKLIKSISENEKAEKINENYYELAQELSRNGDYEKAELYMNKAIQRELNIKNSKKIAEYYRELAKIQEILNKYETSAENYEKAASLAEDDIQKQINKNDALRLKYKSSPKKKLEYLDQNSRLLNSSSFNKEKIENYTQMANTNIALKQNDKALENYKNALDVADSNSENSILIKSDMANLMAETKNYTKAIDIQKEVVEQAKEKTGVETQVKQLRNLSSLYFSADSAAKGLDILQDAYKLAVKRGNLKEAKSSLMLLANYYEKKKDNQEGLKLYKDFINQLEPLISNDSSLIDKSIFLINEGRILQLEQEQTLKDELIQRKNRYNYMLTGSVLLLLFLLATIIKAWISIKKRNKQIALQSLRREMNPHFIFNSLNSVNQFIANNNELEANKYLTAYSNLMRNTMENSNKDYVTLSVELEQLTKYLDLEKLRFADKFEYTIDVDSAINADTVMIPNMIIQPNLENAIWHGLRYKESIGLLQLKFCKEGDKMQIIIDDNGIGLKKSQNIKTKNQKLHESLGLKNVKERIRLLNEIYKTDIQIEITEKSGDETGVVVKIEL